MPWPHHCRRCHAAATGVDAFDFLAHPPSYAAVLRGHDAQSLRALLAALERGHLGGVTEWCPCCRRFGLLFFPLHAAHGGAPAGPAAAEHLLALGELAVLLDIAGAGPDTAGAGPDTLAAVAGALTRPCRARALTPPCRRDP
jgi:hypothetical protein